MVGYYEPSHRGLEPSQRSSPLGASFVIPFHPWPQKIFTEDSEGNEDLDFSLENLR
jgi:hypothetical protein